MESNIKIAIASGKGGTGKTFVSTNLFHVLQKKGHHIVLVDCDAEEPNDRAFIKGELQQRTDVVQKAPVIDKSVCTFCGECSNYCNYNAIFFLKEASMIQVFNELCHGCGACSVACTYDAIKEKDDMLGQVNKYSVSSNSSVIEARMQVGVYSPVKVIQEAIKEASSYDLVLLDSPPGTSCPFIQTVVKADYVVLVTEPTPFGLSDLMQSVDILKGMNKPCGVIVNRAGLGNRDMYEYLQLENIPLLMEVPFSKDIAIAYSNGILPTDIDTNWEEKFHELYLNIKKAYGNCHH